jgi:hypothetical protein
MFDRSLAARSSHANACSVSPSPRYALRNAVAFLHSPPKFVNKLQSLYAATTVCVSSGERSQHRRAAIGQRCRFFQCSDRLIELLGADKREAKRPRSQRIVGLCFQPLPKF